MVRKWKANGRYGGLELPQLTTKRLLLVPFEIELIRAAIQDRAELESRLSARIHSEWPFIQHTFYPSS